MKAFVLGSYGSSDHLDLTAVDTPVPAADEVMTQAWVSPATNATVRNGVTAADCTDGELVPTALLARTSNR